MKKNSERLDKFQKLLKTNKNKYTAQETFDRRERIYKGTMRDITPITEAEKNMKLRASYVYNIVRENIEAMIDSNIPMPKVTAKRKEDEGLATMIENFLRQEIDRMSFETMNDEQERTVRIQGGTHYHVEFDSRLRTHDTAGELVVSSLHPKRVIPQSGIFDGIQKMDYLFLEIPKTKASIKSEYGIDVSDEGESEMTLKTTDGSRSEEEMVTQEIVYYRNKSGGIGKYSWVGETQLEDLEDCQTRRLRKCAKCGAPEPLGEVDILEFPAVNGMQPPENVRDKRKRGEDKCPYCGSSKWEDSEEEFEEIYIPITSTKKQHLVPGVMGEEPTKIPIYKPDVFPVILQKNVSLYGEYLGASDVDAIADIQNGMNRLTKNIFDRLLSAGTVITLPDDPNIRMDPENNKIIYLQNPADKAMIDTIEFTGDMSWHMNWLAQIYEQARNILGITDSFQGRNDDTAQSGIAKQTAAQQSAGRMESQKVMKQTAYAELYEYMFKFALAYMDEPRPIMFKGRDGQMEYDTFDRYDFLELDPDTLEWYWNTDFTFSTDPSSGLAQNRTGMWQEITSQLQFGAFGDPAQMETLATYWRLMAQHHYPGAAEIHREMLEKMQRQQMEQQQQMQMQQQMAAQQQQLQDAKTQAEIDKLKSESAKNDFDSTIKAMDTAGHYIGGQSNSDSMPVVNNNGVADAFMEGVEE